MDKTGTTRIGNPIGRRCRRRAELWNTGRLARTHPDGSVAHRDVDLDARYQLSLPLPDAGLLNLRTVRPFSCWLHVFGAAVIVVVLHCLSRAATPGGVYLGFRVGLEAGGATKTDDSALKVPNAAPPPGLSAVTSLARCKFALGAFQNSEHLSTATNTRRAFIPTTRLSVKCSAPAARARATRVEDMVHGRSISR